MIYKGDSVLRGDSVLPAPSDGTSVDGDGAVDGDGSVIDGSDDGPLANSAADGVDAAVATAPQGQIVAPETMRRWLVVSDVCSIAVGLLFASVLLQMLAPTSRSVLVQQLALATAILPVWVGAMGFLRLFRARSIRRPEEEVRRILTAGMLGISALLAISFAVQFKYMSRLWVLLLYVCVCGLLLVSRTVIRIVYGRLRRAGRAVRPVVVVGTGLDAIAFVHSMEREPGHGYDVVGLIGDDIGTRAGQRVLGPVEDTERIIAETGATGAILSLGSVPQASVNGLTRRLTAAGVHVELLSGLTDIDVTRMRPQAIDGRVMVYVEHTAHNGWQPQLKRCFDVTLAGLGLVVLSPLLLATAIAVKMSSPGPVIFKQNRVGLEGTPFRMLKFRTMVEDAEQRKAALQERNEADGPLFKIADDPRITRVGAKLRKTSIDELPQLWNVIKGEMSLVGPRPALPEEAAQWDAEVSERLTVRPGITGMWQVYGRSDVDFEQYKRLDSFYVDNWSFAHDLKILARTVWVVGAAHGAR